MDQNLTKQLGAWLATPAEKRNLDEGATLFLQLSNNRILYANFLRAPSRTAKMLEYQLQKYYNFRVRELTHEQVSEMATQVKEIAVKDKLTAIPTSASMSNGKVEEGTNPAEARKGKRVDHDSLPQEIQALYVENLSILQRMRNVHSKLELLSVENATCPDSERYPFLKEIIELDKQYHANWKTYDTYQASQISPTPTKATAKVAKSPKATKTTRKPKS